MHRFIVAILLLAAPYGVFASPARCLQTPTFSPLARVSAWGSLMIPRFGRCRWRWGFGSRDRLDSLVPTRIRQTTEPRESTFHTGAGPWRPTTAWVAWFPPATSCAQKENQERACPSLVSGETTSMGMDSWIWPLGKIEP